MATMMMDRGTMTGMAAAGVSPSMGMPQATNMMMVPRCTMKIEKCQGGLKISCVCDDKTACGMMQNLCQMLQGGMCSCCLTMNGLMVCCCNLTMGMCKCDMTDKGCTITCTSGDAKCCEMIQACGECMSCMLKAGCTCCVLMNNTPVCCGC